MRRYRARHRGYEVFDRNGYSTVVRSRKGARAVRRRIDGGSMYGPLLGAWRALIFKGAAPSRYSKALSRI